MKILNDATFNDLMQKATNYDAVVNGMVASGANADDITPQSILDAMEPKDDTDDDKPDVTALNQQIKTLTSERDSAVERAETAENRVTELEQIPGSESAGGKKPIHDGNAEPSVEEVNSYAKSHQNDFASCVEKVRSIL